MLQTVNQKEIIRLENAVIDAERNINEYKRKIVELEEFMFDEKKSLKEEMARLHSLRDELEERQSLEN